ncbi:MAG: hypothetical protein M3252_05175 [Actinomycetota bacterium]|nr:hypothetical protein [Actinomycetota bacterium]
MEDPLDELALNAASLVIGLAGAAGSAIPRRLAPAQPSELPRLENADLEVSLDHRHSQGSDDRDRLHLVVENRGSGPARDIDVALLPVDQVGRSAELRPRQRIRLPALDQGERRAVPVTALPGPVVAATCRWSDAFADYERHRLLQAR